MQCQTNAGFGSSQPGDEVRQVELVWEHKTQRYSWLVYALHIDELVRVKTEMTSKEDTAAYHAS